MDTNEGKEQSSLSKKLVAPFTTGLRAKKLLHETSPWRLHLVFVSGTEAYLGVSSLASNLVRPMGIPRLRLSRSAPSRATLKHEEVWHHLIPAAEWDDRLSHSMRAVDMALCREA